MEDKIRINTTVYGDGRIVQDQAMVDNLREIERKIMTQVIFTQDQHVRDSLIKLGWAPPPKESRGGMVYPNITLEDIVMSSKKIENGRYWEVGLQLVDGCTPCSPGCDHCWSAAMTHRFNFQWTKDGKPEFNGHITVRPERLSIPLKRRKPTVYACWNDLYHEAVPDEFIGDAWQIMAECSEKHTFLILTKRAERAAEITNKYSFVDFGNVYHGLTVCNQQEADEKIPVFLHVQGKKFLSIEPCLGEIKLFGDDYDWTENGRDCKKSCINSVILGGETGPGARPMHPDWAISIVRQCRAAGVPFFFKGWGEWTPEIPPKYCKLSGKRWSHESVSWARDGSKYNPLYPPPDHFPSVTVYRAGRKAAGRLLDGREWNDLLWVKS